MSINNEYNMVKEFHETFGHPVENKPILLTMQRANARVDWMREEIDEFIEATVNNDIYEQADAMTDLIYFALGTLVEMGVPPAEVFKVVQEANMSKVWKDGTLHRREDGKVIKPPEWQDPHDKIVKVIDDMR